MISLLLFFLLLSSGSVFAAVYRKRAYEETVPLTIFCIVEIIFLFGLIDHLRWGVWAACLICVGLYGFALRRILQTNAWKETASLLFTPAFFIFLALLVIYAFCIVGWVSFQTDSYYFWGLSTKQMWHLDTFHCVSGTETLFAEYPPGMQLFEFFLLVLKGECSEWRMLFAYSTLLFSLFIPFLKGLPRKFNIQYILIGLVILMSGSVFYEWWIVSLYADFPLGAIFAYGMASVFLLRKRDGQWDYMDIANIVMAANMLVLVKSAGKLFAILLLFALGLILCWNTNKREVVSVSYKKIFTGVGIFLPMITAWLWKIKYTYYQQHVYFETSKYDLREFIQILFGNTDGGYRAAIKESFISFLKNETIAVGFLTLSNLQIILLIFAVGALLLYLLRGKYTIGGRISVSVLFTGVGIYWLGLLASYMYTFSEYEGTILASMQRYLNIYHTALVLFSVLLLFFWLSSSDPNKGLSCCVLLLCLSICSMPGFVDLITRNWVDISNGGVRQELSPIVESLKREEHPDNSTSRVLLIDKPEGNYGYSVILGYILYPDYWFSWTCSFGSQPAFEGDGNTRILTKDEFYQYIEDNTIDYIAIRQVDQDFIDTYRELFDSSIQNGEVYKVSTDKELFELLTA